MQSEVNDKDTDLLKFSDSDFRKFDKATLEHAYNTFLKILKPTFSGSVDHRINKIDFTKINKMLS